MTERCKLRSREPSRICTRRKIALQKNRKKDVKRVLGAVPGSSILNKFRQSTVVFGKSMSVLITNVAKA